jgi:hypothetical protein
VSLYKDIIEKLRLKMPLVVTLPDPISGEPFSVNRDNILQLLVIDTSNTLFEEASLPALYAEMARINAAAKKSVEDEERNLRKWKAQMRAECRRVSDKKPTDRACDDYYQNHAEYDDRYRKVTDLKVLVGFTEDLKKAFELKSKSLHDIAGELYGHNKAQDSTERLTDMALENLALQTMQESGSAAAAADFREGLQSPPPPPPPVSDTEETPASESKKETGKNKSGKSGTTRKPRRTRKARSVPGKGESK